MRSPLLIPRLTNLLLALAAAIPVAGLTAQATPGYHLVGWNNLGMHCMDSDYSVFSILPPFNTVDLQMIDPTGHLVRSAAGLTLTYEAVADPSGSINRSSVGKTNYWLYAGQLYGGNTTPDAGLTGFDMPGPANTPRPFGFNATTAVFEAEGIPLTPFDDAGHHRPYPLMRLSARDAAGTLLAHGDAVLPVSDEMDCRLCHGSGTGAAAQPAAGWVFDANSERDYRLNVLRLHDDRHLGSPAYIAALTQAGYATAGLYAHVVTTGSPILCARCHRSNALPGTGIAGITQLTTALHTRHATALDPTTGLPLDATANRASCYRCHPGSEDRCLRGAMGNAVAADGSRSIQCQSCHGQMAFVGRQGREGWFDEPGCQTCHTGTATRNNGQIRYSNAFASLGNLRVAVDPTFATTPNAPAPGVSLYRFSTGHGGLRCEACHGSTHAEYPAVQGNDNLQVTELQGHVGTLSECAACHANQPLSRSGGPHGMHTIGLAWVNGHGDAAEGNATACQACHGLDYRGTVLSRAQGDRSFGTRFGVKTFARGAAVGCYVCHQGPSSENGNPNRSPLAVDAVASTVDTAVAIDLVASDPDNDPLTFRILAQPQHGTVALSGAHASYQPEAGFAGTDTFTFVASDGSVDSIPGSVRVARGATWANYGIGYPGTADLVPSFTSDARPILGNTLQLAVQNTSGTASLAILAASTESSNLPSGFGGAMLTENALLSTFVMPAGGSVLPLLVPNIAAFLGTPLCMQVAEFDAGARFQLAFTRGLRLLPGR